MKFSKIAIAAVGSYGGQNALAIGYARRINDNWSAKAPATRSLNGAGRTGFAASASFGW